MHHTYKFPYYYPIAYCKPTYYKYNYLVPYKRGISNWCSSTKKIYSTDIITFDKPSLMIFCGFQIGSCRKKKGVTRREVVYCGYNDTIIIFLYAAAAASKKWDFNFTETFFKKFRVTSFSFMRTIL